LPNNPKTSSIYAQLKLYTIRATGFIKKNEERK
jgi:hypothetical protein